MLHINVSLSSLHMYAGLLVALDAFWRGCGHLVEAPGTDDAEPSTVFCKNMPKAI